MQSTEFRLRVIALEVLVERYRRITIAEEAFIIAVCFYTSFARIVLQTGLVITCGVVAICSNENYGV